jgi:hypothetical protein
MRKVSGARHRSIAGTRAVLDRVKCAEGVPSRVSLPWPATGMGHAPRPSKVDRSATSRGVGEASSLVRWTGYIANTAWTCGGAAYAPRTVPAAFRSTIVDGRSSVQTAIQPSHPHPPVSFPRLSRRYVFPHAERGKRKMKP